MVPDILSSIEKELRKRIDLRRARITLTEKCLVVLVFGNLGSRSTERHLRLWLNGRWSITGAPTEGIDSTLLAEGNLAHSGKSISARDLDRIAAMLRVTPAGRGD